MKLLHQGKKIIAYEEGQLNVASNKSHSYSKSRIALIIASSVSTGSTIEAWCVTLQDNKQFHLINPDVLGAALFWPLEKVSPFPFICVVQTISFEHVIQIIDVCDASSKISASTQLLVQTKLDDDIFKDIDNVAEPVTMAMGSTPYALILCLGNIVVIAYRKYGIILAFIYTNENDNHELVLFGQENVGQYIVDASICYNKEVEREDNGDMSTIEVILLLGDRMNSKDANIGKVFFDR